MGNVGLEQTVALLNEVLELRLAGVLKYTQYSLMVSGYTKLSLSSLFTDLASQSLWQAQESGRLLTAMNERPDLSLPSFSEPQNQSSREMLLRSLNHERKLLELHRTLLCNTQSLGSYLEQLAASMLITAESQSRELSHQLGELEAPVYVGLSA